MFDQNTCPAMAIVQDAVSDSSVEGQEGSICEFVAKCCRSPLPLI